GRDVLRRRVQRVRHRTILLRPVPGPDVVRAPPEQQVKPLAVRGIDRLSYGRIRVRERPAAMAEAAVAIFLRPAGPLDHTVQRDVLDDPDLPHVLSPLMRQRLPSIGARHSASSLSGQRAARLLSPVPPAPGAPPFDRWRTRRDSAPEAPLL